MAAGFVPRATLELRRFVVGTLVTAPVIRRRSKRQEGSVKRLALRLSVASLVRQRRSNCPEDGIVNSVVHDAYARYMLGQEGLEDA